MKEEYILCAAIHFDDKKIYVHQPINISTGFVVSGRRHHNCFALYHATQLLKGTIDGDIGKKHYEFELEQGFLTSLDRFVDRTEGGEIAFKANQTKEQKKVLFSEDLY